MNKEVIEFLVEAKQNTYAGKNNQVESSRSGSVDFEYIKGDYKYSDSYVGSTHFTGQEIVWIKDNPYWSMNYVGRVVNDNFSGDFLKEALLHVNTDMPYRGPEKYENGDYIYICNYDGDFDWFEGRELIFYKDKQIFELRFNGGLLK